MARPVAVSLLLLAASCFQPSYPVGLACSDAGTCPPGQVCRAALCRYPGDEGPPDAGPDDAIVEPHADARPDAAHSAAGLGTPCTGVILCPETTPICRSTDGISSDGWCTIECGVPGDGGLEPDDGPCQDGYAQAAGVPRCSFFDGTRWFCGLFCGAGIVPTDDGACPYDLRCAFDRDGDPGYEICVE